LASTEVNDLEFTISTNNTIDDVAYQIDSGDRLFSTVLNSARIELKANLHKELANSLKSFLENIDPSLGNIPPLVFL